MHTRFFGLFLLALACVRCGDPPPPPEPIPPLPSEAQLAWHDLQYYMFVHFNMNTFTNMEWGMGDESPETFNPTELDCTQWARIAKEAGMKGIILTAKHHDGFCLWPSAYTEHSVKNAPWKNGKGDVVRELADACKQYELEMGVYLSPWDRNHPDYGTEAYLTYFRNQLRELLTNYGEVFELWFDGANGGMGYYGGANEERKVDRKTYYDWPATHELAFELMPNLIIFSDAGPGCRWVGNEAGWADSTNWSPLRRDEFYPGSPNYKELVRGHEDGTHWVPAEVDVSIRPGWYYHPYEDHKVKSLDELVDIYYHSIGRNSNLLLNVPADTRGLIHEADEERLMQLAAVIRDDFAYNLLEEARLTSEQSRGSAAAYAARRAADGDPATYWATDDGQRTGEIIMEFDQAVQVNRLLLQEYVALGQRVKAFRFQAWQDEAWKTISTQTTIGYKRILRFPELTANRFRVQILDAKGPPLISEMGLFHAPRLMVAPHIRRNKQGLVSLEASEPGLEVYYTLDGSDPTIRSKPYEAPFQLGKPTELRAMTHDPGSGRNSPVATALFDAPKASWSVVRVSSGSTDAAIKAIDDDPDSWWSSSEQRRLPQELVIDLGDTLELHGFTYLPMQERWMSGVIADYELYTSINGRSWGWPNAKGTFSNIERNPITQYVYFDQPRKARFLRFRAMKSMDETMGVAELGVITTPEQQSSSDETQ